MKKKVGTGIVCVVLACICLAWFLHRPEQQKSEESLHMCITMEIKGVSFDEAVSVIEAEATARALVENLMLPCAPEDLRQTIIVERTKEQDMLIVMVPMDQGENIVYLSDELSDILIQSLQVKGEDVSVRVCEEQQIMIGR